MKIDSQYASKVTVQKYGQKPQIEGVEIIHIPWQSDDGGNFGEIVRLQGGHLDGFKTPFEAKQVSVSIMTPGTIKAFHLHNNQDDLWYTLPTERLIVNLHDIREDSPTKGNHIRLVMGAGKNFLLRIPKGVAHGVANKYERNMILFYFTNQQFSMENPDENRLPWDTFGTANWDITKG
jgi:dTDP-4-dehydrorhamnose 3,5-epimerase